MLDCRLGLFIFFCVAISALMEKLEIKAEIGNYPSSGSSDDMEESTQRELSGFKDNEDRSDDDLIVGAVEKIPKSFGAELQLHNSLPAERTISRLGCPNN